MIEWRRIPLPRYRNYEVSDDGRVRRGTRELKGDVDRYGYRRVLLYYAGLRERFKVHRLVCEAFHGPCPEGHECGHLDGNPANNAAANLAWITRSENTRDQLAHGTFAGTANLTPGQRFGEANPSATLTDQQVSAIRQDAVNGLGGRRLAAKYGISRSTAHRIVSGQQRPVGGDAR